MVIKNKSITAHMVLYNEDQWVWYAIQSVLTHIDQIIVWDTGSTDNTVKIVRSIASDKISFREIGRCTPSQLVELRNKQILETKSEWFLLVDGDEAWPKSSISALVELLPTLPKEIMGVVVKARLPVGDLYHYQPESAGHYKLLGNIGHYNIRAYRKKTNYRWQGIYPLEAYTDSSGNAINSQDDKLTYLAHHEYWHLRHLVRSSVSSRSKKLERGREEKVSLPDVFWEKRPDFVPSPWLTSTPTEILAMNMISPFLSIKRRIQRLVNA